MIRILVKHCIYEICLEVVFSSAHANFQKPVTEKQQVLGALVASILAKAKLIQTATRVPNTHYIIYNIKED